MSPDDPKGYPELFALWPNMPEHVEPFDFNDENVPPNLRALIPYARIWGQSDDAYRCDILQRTPTTLRTHLKSVVIEREIDLEAWLAGPESKSAHRTSAFDAFVALLITADSV